MKLVRIIMLGLALVAGGLALLIMMNAPGPVQEVAAPAAPVVVMDEVMVAAIDLPSGRMIEEGDFAWQKTAPANVQPGMILRRNGEALTDLRGAYVRQTIASGEPIRRERLIRAGRAAGFLAANLPPGMRAVAIAVDPSGLSTAGGFVQPSDRVDVVKLARDEDGISADAQGAQVLLRNVRVLAIGQLAERNLERAVMSATATLEVTPAQAELLLVAQRTAHLTLVLRSSAEQSQAPETGADPAGGIANVVRYGVLTGAR